ncbi:Protein will die slowly [Gryllus bimaculatus]|nr:Protein will die slowly [Gryllus bimaculatus]
MANVPKRVKLYLLDNDQQWIDKGTGRIICTSCANLYSLKVHSELDDSILLDTDILPDISFEKQQETLILWCDKNENEFALSFQEKEACEAVWKVIRSVADEGQDVAVLEGHTREVVSLHFSNSGQQILTGSFDGTIGIWDTRTAKREGLLVGHSEEISNCLYNFDCSLIASSSMDKTAKIWDPRTMSCLTTITGHQDEILDIAFDYKGQRLATASGDATAMVWDVHSNCNVVAVMQGHSEEVSKVCFSPAGNQLLTASLDQTARLWNAETGICSQVLSGHKDDVFSCCFSYSGHVIITASKDNTCRIWRKVCSN